MHDNACKSDMNTFDTHMYCKFVAQSLVTAPNLLVAYLVHPDYIRFRSDCPPFSA